MADAPTPAPVSIPGAYKPGDKLLDSIGLCIYGKSGAGKTSLLATMPGRGLVVDVPQIEGGNFVLRPYKDRIDVRDVESWDDIDDIYWWLKKTPHDYKWVALDSITAFAELARRKTVKERTLAEDPHTTSQQEWGKIGSLVGELIYRFRVLPIHTIWVAQERKFGDEQRGEPVQLGPALSPAALSALQPSMFLIGRLSVDERMDGTTERRLRVGPHSLYISKIRALPGQDMPPLIANPHLGRILRYALGVEGAKRPDQVDEGFLIL